MDHQIGCDVLGLGTAVRRLYLQLIGSLIANQFLNSTDYTIVEIDGEPIGVLAMQPVNDSRVLTVIVVVCFRAEDKVTLKKNSQHFCPRLTN